jgi:hypothetical protein
MSTLAIALAIPSFHSFSTNNNDQPYRIQKQDYIEYIRQWYFHVRLPLFHQCDGGGGCRRRHLVVP